MPSIKPRLYIIFICSSFALATYPDSSCSSTLTKGPSTCQTPDFSSLQDPNFGIPFYSVSTTWGNIQCLARVRRAVRCVPVWPLGQIWRRQFVTAMAKIGLLASTSSSPLSVSSMLRPQTASTNLRIPSGVGACGSRVFALHRTSALRYPSTSA